MCKLLVGRQEEQAIDEALALADDAVPNAVHARDALEHCDDYIFGVGNLQGTDPTADYAQKYARRDVPIVEVGPFIIDVDRAERIAQELASVVVVAKVPRAAARTTARRYRPAEELHRS